ncbi:MAG: hypothetical protein SVC26_09795 [Pseudomonadota bacterium]|nr:hypothetical protein [Pseudomonadota bacterium]
MSLTTVTDDFYKPKIIHIKTAVNLMTGRSKTMELVIDDMIYQVLLVDPKKTTRLSCGSKQGAEQLFNNFNIDRE